MSNIADDFLAEIERFLEATGMPPTNLGLASVNDGHLVRKLRAGLVDPRASTIDKVRKYMLDHLAARNVAARAGEKRSNGRRKAA
jgi:predicted transcriptional regulator